MNVSAPKLPTAVQAGLEGARRARQRLAATAKQVSSGQGDLIDHLVELRSAQQDHNANVAVLRTALRTEQTALDILA